MGDDKKQPAAEEATSADGFEEMKTKAEKLINEVSQIQNGTGSGTPVREGAASLRNFIDTQRSAWFDLKNRVKTQAQEAKNFPKAFVSETAVLQSDFLLKLCKHQPMAVVSLTTLSVMLPAAALVGRRTALFSGIMSAAVSYALVNAIRTTTPAGKGKGRGKDDARTGYHYSVHASEPPHPPQVHPSADSFKKDR